jgi:glycosyltransferase involved in cell wall biosynthesis
VSDPEAGKADLAAVLLGMGWFPDQPGGLNRYLRGLLDALTAIGVDARAIVVGPVSQRRSDVDVAATAQAPLRERVTAFARCATQHASADVIDAHFALYAFLPVVLGRLRSRPLVVHFQGPWADENVVAGDRSRLRAYLRRLLERRVYRRADELVVLSRAFGRILVEQYGVSPWRISVIPPGVDLECFSPGDRKASRERLNLGEHELVALAVRRLVPRMGLDILLEAWRRVPGQRTLLIAGEGPLRAELEQQARRIGGEGSVRFLGRVGDDELVACYRAADVCVLPSIGLEGFGLAALEALACGTPVIASDCGGLPEVIAPLDPSLLVPVGDAGALAERLASDARLPTSTDCRAYAERFSWERAAKRHLDVYARAVTRARRDRPRVVYLDHSATLSGGELALLRLLGTLEVDAHVILAEEGPLVARLLAAGISVEVMPLAARARAHRRRASGLSSLAAVPATALYTLRLARRLRRLRPDLVHTNSLKADLYGGAAARMAGVPVLWHVRDRIADDYLSPSGVRLMRAAGRLLPAVVVANSSDTLAMLGNLRAPAHVVPSSVDGNAGPRRERDGPLRVGIVGRIAPWKGQHVFIDAFATAFPAGPEQAVVVGAPLFGADEDRYLDELRSLAAERGLGGRIEFTGFRDDVAGELARLDVLVHASVVPEPFGQVVVEGMAAGLPVVATAAGGPAEIVEDGVNGLLYPPGDVEALAQTLRRLAADATLRARLGANARERARDFDPIRIAERMREIYAETLRRR